VTTFFLFVLDLTGAAVSFLLGSSISLFLGGGGAVSNFATLTLFPIFLNGSVASPFILLRLKSRLWVGGEVRVG
jgi:hypothetical protein